METTCEVSPVASSSTVTLIDESDIVDSFAYEQSDATSYNLLQTETECDKLEPSVDASYNFDPSHDQLPVISPRCSARKDPPQRSARNQMQDRVRKNREQVAYLKKVFEETGGVLNRAQRKKAMRVTGLCWIQIYKWLFDKKLKQARKISMENSCLPQQIFRVIGPDGREIGKPQPIFKIEKVQRNSM